MWSAETLIQWDTLRRILVTVLPKGIQGISRTFLTKPIVTLGLITTDLHGRKVVFSKSEATPSKCNGPRSLPTLLSIFLVLEKDLFYLSLPQGIRGKPPKSRH